MAEDLLSKYVDRVSFADDTKFALEQLALLEKEYIKLRDFKNSLNTSFGLKDIGTSAQSATKQLQGLNVALQEQTKILGAHVQANKTEIASLEQNISVRNRYKNTLESIKKDDKENFDLLKKKIITEDEYQKRLIEGAAQQEKYKVKIAEANKEIKAQINLQNTPANTIARAQAENKTLTAQRNLTPTNDPETIAKLNAQIDRNNELIDKNSDSLAKQKINIGNYQGAANSIVEGLGKQEVKLQSLGNAYTSFGSQIATQKNVINGFKGDINSADYKKATAELARLESEYKRTGVEVNKTRTVIEGFRRAADISVQQAPTTAALDKSSAAYAGTSQALNGYVTVLRGSRGPTKLLGEALGIGAQQADTLRLVIEHSLQGFAAYFRSKKASAAAAEEAATALAAETAAASSGLGVTEAQTIAQTNLAAAQGATVITTQAEVAAQAELDALMGTGIATIEAQVAAQSQLASASVAAAIAIQAEDIAATQLIAAYSADTIAATAATGATTALAASEVVATGATTALNTALKFSGIGLLIGAIGFAVVGIVELVKHIREAAAAQKLLNDIFEEAGKSAGADIASLELLRSKITDLKAPSEERLRALQQYNDNADKGNKIDATQINNIDLVNKGITAQIALLQQRAVAKAFENKLGEAAEKLVTAQIKRDLGAAQAKQSLADANKAVDASKDSNNARDIQNQRDGIVLAIKSRQENVDSAQKEFDSLLALSNKYVNSDVFLTGKKDPKEKKQKGEKNIANIQKELNTEFEIYKLNQARLIELYKEEADDQKLPLTKRLDALNSFFIESKKLIGEQEEFDKQAKQREAQREVDNLNKDKKGKSGAQVARIDENIKLIESNLQQELLLIESKGNDERIKAGKTFGKEREAIVKSNGDKIKKVLEDSFKDLNKGEDKNLNAEKLENEKYKYLELRKLAKDFKDGKLNDVADFEKKKAEIEKRYETAELNAELQTEEVKLKIAQIFNLDTIDIERKIFAIKQQLLNKDVDATKEAADKKAEIKKKELELLKDAKTAFIAIVDGQFDREKNRIADQQTEVDKKKEKDLAANEALVQSEEKKAANIAIINARAQTQKEALDRRQKKIDHDKAVFDRAVAVATIITNTAIAVSNDLKYNKFLIPFDIAIGAAQLIAVLARPIPKFKTGKNNDYEGPAIVGDGGVAEYIERADGTLERTPAKDTLTYLGKDDIVHPDLMSLMLSRAMPAIDFPVQKRDNSFERMESYMQAQIPLLNKIANKRENHLSAKEGALVSLWKHGANSTKYFDENTNW